MIAHITAFLSHASPISMKHTPSICMMYPCNGSIFSGNYGGGGCQKCSSLFAGQSILAPQPKDYITEIVLQLCFKGN